MIAVTFAATVTGEAALARLAAKAHREEDGTNDVRVVTAAVRPGPKEGGSAPKAARGPILAEAIGRTPDVTSRANAASPCRCRRLI